MLEKFKLEPEVNLEDSKVEKLDPFELPEIEDWPSIEDFNDTNQDIPVLPDIKDWPSIEDFNDTNQDIPVLPDIKDWPSIEDFNDTNLDIPVLTDVKDWPSIEDFNDTNLDVSVLPDVKDWPSIEDFNDTNLDIPVLTDVKDLPPIGEETYNGPWTEGHFVPTHVFHLNDVEVQSESTENEKKESDSKSNETGEVTEKKVVKIDRNNDDPEQVSNTLNNPEPNTIYEFENGDRTETDEKGRVISHTFTPTLVDEKRTQSQSENTRKVGQEGREGDDGGHIQAHSLGGSADRINLFPQDSNFNRGVYKQFENSVRNDVKEGKDVKVTVKLEYDNPNSTRPDRVVVTKVVDGIPTIITFKNEYGGGKNA